MASEGSEAPAQPSAGSCLMITAAAAALVLLACFPHRLEYPAHVLAGLGVSGFLGALLATSPLARDSRVLIGLGALSMVALTAELGVDGFPLDLLDVANTMAGGVLGAAAVHGAGRFDRNRLLVVSAILIGAGFIVRYPGQAAVENWWLIGS